MINNNTDSIQNNSKNNMQNTTADIADDLAENIELISRTTPTMIPEWMD